MEQLVNTEEELPLAAQKLLQYAGGIKIFLFYAEMGAGKTTFIKTLCRALGSNDGLSSPTYPIVNEYDYPAGKIYHFDLYRIKNVAELHNLGFEEYLDSGHYCFIEWPEVGEKLIEETYIKVELHEQNSQRLIKAFTVTH